MTRVVISPWKRAALDKALAENAAKRARLTERMSERPQKRLV